MRILSAILASVLMLSFVSEADAGKRRKRKPSYDADSYSTRSGGRSSTVDRRGLCQRDNGRPLDSLNLNHRCDREEFWARFNDLGDSRR